MIKKINICIGLLLLIASYAFAQIDKYNYQRELKGVNDQWHKIVLPDDIFDKVSSNLSDIRIFGITADQDTIEAPYVLNILKGERSVSEIDFKIINQSSNDNGYYYTFEVPVDQLINQFKLDFKQQNFDWRIGLEGSHDQQEWFNIVEDYRILSLKNELTDYQFTKVGFPNSKYNYYRLLIKSEEQPELLAARITLHEIEEGRYRNFDIQTVNTNQDKESKQTIIDIDLPSDFPVSHFEINVEDDYDYYRSMTVKYVSDSFKTEKGWKYSYRELTSGTLSSIEDNEWIFTSTILKKIKVIINNNDNLPLSIKSIIVKGYEHELIVRFVQEGSYYLAYGNNKARTPNYDITRFTSNIPDDLTVLDLEEERRIDNVEPAGIKPLFENKALLWVVMGVIILLLGWFTIRMMKNKQ